MESHESTRQRAESSQSKNHEDHIAGNGFTSMSHLQFGTQVHPDANENTEWKKLETIPAWDSGKVKSKKEVFSKHKETKKKVHVAALMDICHLKNAALEPKLQKYRGRVVLRGDVVFDDSGAYAVFTEQGSSASLMTVAKIMVVIGRLPGCDGQAADALSAYTQGKWRTLQHCSKIPKSECPHVWMRLPRHKWPKSWANIQDPVVLPERNLYGHPLARLRWERQFDGTLYENLDGRKFRTGNVCSFIENKDLFNRCMWMTLKFLERSRIWLQCGRN